jgi:CHAT domain-containing protein/tetratricopeptide (TPR) repeat protein
VNILGEVFMFRFNFDFLNLIREKIQNTQWVEGKSELNYAHIKELDKRRFSESELRRYVKYLLEAELHKQTSSQSLQLFWESDDQEDLQKALNASELAIKSYKNALKIRSGSALILNNFGLLLACHQVFSTSSNYNEALNNLWKSVRVNLFYYRAWFNLGVVYKCQKRYIFSQICYFISGFVETFSDILRAVMWCNRIGYKIWRLISPYVIQASHTLTEQILIVGNYSNQQINQLRTDNLSRASRYFNQLLQRIFAAYRLLSSTDDHSGNGQRGNGNIFNSDEKTQSKSVDRLLNGPKHQTTIEFLERLLALSQDSELLFSEQFQTVIDSENSFQDLEDFLREAQRTETTQSKQIEETRSQFNWLASHAMSDFFLSSFDPTLPNDWERLGQSAAVRNRLSEAIFSFLQAAKLTRDRVSARFWYRKGLANFYAGYYEESISNFDRAVDLQPDWIEPLQYKGHANNEIGKYAEAFSSFNKFISQSPKDIWSILGKSNAQYNLDKYDDTLQTLASLIRIKFDEPQFYLRVTYTLIDLGKTAEALSYLNGLLLLYVNHWKSYANLTCLRIKLNDLNISVPKDRKSLDLHFRTQALICSDFYYVAGKMAVAQAKATVKIRDQQEWLELARENLINGFQFLGKQPLDELKLNEQKLEIFELLISVYQLLAEIIVNPLKARTLDKESLALQRDGDAILARLLSQIPSRGKRLRLFMKFFTFSDRRIDQLAQSRSIDEQKQALVLAEIHKNLCLEHIKNEYCEQQLDYQQITYQNIQDILPSDKSTAMLYWHISPAAITTFIVRKDRFIVHRHSQRTIKMLSYIVGFIYQQIVLQRHQNRHSIDLPKSIQQLYDLESWLENWKFNYLDYRNINADKSQHPWRLNMQNRLRKLAGILGISRTRKYLHNIQELILIPHRDLHLLPVHLLFPDHLSIRYLPSAFFREVTGQPLNPRSDGVLFVGGYAPDLRFERWERRAIQELYPNRVMLLEGDKVNRNSFMRLSEYSSIEQADELTTVSIFHFSGHAEHNPSNPLESSLQLRGSVFNVYDILQNSVQFSNYKLICLSACETGITGSRKIIKEYIGLSSAFLSIGCDHVVSSLWRVPDHVTALLMVKFYDNLVNSQSNQEVDLISTVSHSLRNAQKWIKNLRYNELLYFMEKNKEIFFVRPHSLREELVKDFQDEKNRDYSKYDLMIKSTLLTVGYIPFFNSESTEKNQKMPYSHPYYWAGFTVTGMKS